VIPGSPADTAGLSPGDRLVAVNGRKWSRDELRDALAATAHDASKVTLLIERGDLYQSVELSYSGGQREPRLVRVAGTPDLLAQIARPRVPAKH
jgi:predicted metalloprotease with PDZ domain